MSIGYICWDGPTRAFDVPRSAFHIDPISPYFNKRKATVNPRRFGGMLKK
jgi:hypothetical protein